MCYLLFQFFVVFLCKPNKCICFWKKSCLFWKKCNFVRHRICWFHNIFTSNKNQNDIFSWWPLQETWHMRPVISDISPKHYESKKQYKKIGEHDSRCREWSSRLIASRSWLGTIPTGGRWALRQASPPRHQCTHLRWGRRKGLQCRDIKRIRNRMQRVHS